MAATWPPDFGALTRHCERWLVDRLALHPVPLSPDLVHVRGTWQGSPIVARASGYRGAGIALARFATVEGSGMAIGNILVVPEASTWTPILGADLVWIGTRPDVAMIACDLSPTLDTEEARAAQNAATAAVLPDGPRVPPGGALPAWCSAIFSPRPLYTRYGSGDAEAATSALLEYIHAFGSLAEAGGERSVDPAAARRGVRAYCERHREDDRGLMLLERLLGKETARRYIDEILFPTSIDGCMT